MQINVNFPSVNFIDFCLYIFFPDFHVLPVNCSNFSLSLLRHCALEKCSLEWFFALTRALLFVWSAEKKEREIVSECKSFTSAFISLNNLNDALSHFFHAISRAFFVPLFYSRQFFSSLSNVYSFFRVHENWRTKD